MSLKTKKNWLSKRIVFWLCLILIGTYFPFVKDYFVSSGSLDRLFEISITISSILFGVLGIWISTVYGDSLSSFVKGNTEEKNEAIKNLEVLIVPLLLSFLCIVVGVMFFMVKAQLTENFDLNDETKIFLLKLSFTLYFLTTALQFWYLTSIFKPLLGLSYKLERDKIQNRTKAQYFKPSPKKKKN